MVSLINEIKQHIIESLKLDITPEDINPDSPLFGDELGLDSIDVLELVVMLKAHYGIKGSNSQAGRAGLDPRGPIAPGLTPNKPAK